MILVHATMVAVMYMTTLPEDNPMWSAIPAGMPACGAGLGFKVIAGRALTNPQTHCGVTCTHCRVLMDAAMDGALTFKDGKLVVNQRR